jgi:hypothetical protein
MRRGRVAVVCGAAVVAAVAVLGFPAELVRSHFVRTSATANYVTLPAAIAIGAIVVAVLVTTRNARVGSLLLIGAAGTGVGYWRYSTHPWLAVVGFAATLTTALFTLHAAVLHGGGLGVGWQRALRAAEALLLVIGLAALGTARAGVIDRWFVAADPFRNVHNHVLVVDAPGFARTLYRTWWIVLLAAAGSAVVARWARWRTEPRAAQRNEFPVVLAATGWTACVAIAAAGLLVDRVPGAHESVADFTAAVVPTIGLGIVALALGWVELVAPRLGRVHEGRVEIRILQPEDDRALRAILADVLATTDVDVLFGHEGAWIDANGRLASLPDDVRRATIVRRRGEAIAAVLHQPDVPFEAIDLAARDRSPLGSAARNRARACKHRGRPAGDGAPRAGRRPCRRARCPRGRGGATHAS